MGGLSGTVTLPIWKDFQVKYTAFYDREIKQNPTGEIRLIIDSNAPFPQQKIEDSQVRAYEYLTGHAEEIYTTLLTRLMAEYDELQEDFGYDDDDGELRKKLMPPVEKMEDFRPLLELNSIIIRPPGDDGISKIGFEFLCSWDDEHGVGFMTQEGEILAFGGGGYGGDWVKIYQERNQFNSLSINYKSD